MSLDKIKTEYRKDFYKTYHNDVVPLLSRFETERKLYLKIFYIAETLVFTAFTALLIYIINNFIHCNNIVFIFLFLIIMLAAIIPFCINNAYIKKLKSYCMKPILKIFGEIQWAKNMIANSDLNMSDLFATFNRRSNDDGFHGEYKGVNFEISETSLSYESGSGKRRTVVQVFKGVVIKFKSNKTIKNKTIIATRGDMNIRRTNSLAMFLAILPVVVNIFTMRLKLIAIAIILAVITLLVIISIKTQKNEEKMHEVKLEDPEFNKKFKVYSSDQVESRYLVTTAFMERFINLNTAFGAKNAKCSFYGDNIMIAISTNRNLFEIGNLFRNANNPEQLTKFFEEFSSIILLVDYFKLNERTGL